MKVPVAVLLALCLLSNLVTSAQVDKKKPKKKALPKQSAPQMQPIVPVESLPIMTSLPGVGMKIVSVTNGHGTYLDSIITPKGLLIFFISNSCDYAEKSADHWKAMIKYAQEKGIGYALINTHAANDTMNTPLKMENFAIRHNIRYDYFSDEGGMIARLFKVSYLPEVYLFGGDRKLYYTGPIEDNPSEPKLSQTIYIKNAIDSMIKPGMPPLPSVLFHKPGCEFSPGR